MIKLDICLQTGKGKGLIVKIVRYNPLLKFNN